MISWGPSTPAYDGPVDSRLAEHLDAAWDGGFGVERDGLETQDADQLTSEPAGSEG